MSDLPPQATTPPPPAPIGWPPQPDPSLPPSVAPPSAVPPPTYTAPPAQPAQAVPSAPAPDIDGVVRGNFTSRKAAKRVILNVDGVEYECATTAPSDPLLEAVEAQETKNHWRLMQALRVLVPAVMYPEARARYEARLKGATDEGGPIDPSEFLAHGLWLVGVYFGTPTDGPAPSGAGPATHPSPANSTAGPSPTA